MFNNNLQKIRYEKGLIARDIYEKIGMRYDTYSKKENGRSKFTLEEAYKISKVLNMSIEKIFFHN